MFKERWRAVLNNLLIRCLCAFSISNKKNFNEKNKNKTGLNRRINILFNKNVVFRMFTVRN